MNEELDVRHHREMLGELEAVEGLDTVLVAQPGLERSLVGLAPVEAQTEQIELGIRLKRESGALSDF